MAATDCAVADNFRVHGLAKRAVEPMAGPACKAVARAVVPEVVVGPVSTCPCPESVRGKGLERASFGESLHAFSTLNPTEAEPVPSPPAIPKLTGVEHIGLTVPDIEAATRFFVDVVGAESVYDIGPFESADDWMASHLAVHPRARINKLRLLKVANGPALELFEFTSPDQNTSLPRNSDHGGWHLAFYVEDMERALVALKAHQVRIQSGPVTMTEGPSAGLQWLYFQAPWGQQLELVSYPDGIEAYRERRLRMWRPH